MIRDFPTGNTPALRASAQAWLDGNQPAPPVARPAATVMIVRDRADGSGGSAVEVFMLRRVASMAFAPSTMVFPGGGVDARDGAELPWAGPPVLLWQARLGSDDDSTRMLVVAAVREVFEECGVLFASESPSGPLVDVSTAEWTEVRRGLVARELSLNDVLRRHGLVLRTDLLRAEAHWVTPVFEPRRFDTRFFVALMPAGRDIDGATSEADHSGWFDPATVLADAEAGQAVLLPPTVVCLEHLTRAESALDFFDEQPVIRKIMPELAITEANEVVMRVDTRP